jgi:hypothetical protein
MIDKTNPTNQFHPYQPPEADIAPPASHIDMKQSIEKARNFARSNPGALLGGLAAAAIGLGLLRRNRAKTV